MSMLQSTPLLSISQLERRKLFTTLEPVMFKNGDNVVCESAKGSEFYMITSGEPLVEKSMDGMRDLVRHKTTSTAYAAYYESLIDR